MHQEHAALVALKAWWGEYRTRNTLVTATNL